MRQPQRPRRGDRCLIRRPGRGLPSRCRSNGRWRWTARQRRGPRPKPPLRPTLPAQDFGSYNAGALVNPDELAASGHRHRRRAPEAEGPPRRRHRLGLPCAPARHPRRHARARAEDRRVGVAGRRPPLCHDGQAGNCAASPFRMSTTRGTAGGGPGAEGRGQNRQSHLRQRRRAARGHRAPGRSRQGDFAIYGQGGSRLPPAPARPSWRRFPPRRRLSAASRFISPRRADGHGRGSGRRHQAAVQRRGDRAAASISSPATSPRPGSTIRSSSPCSRAASSSPPISSGRSTARGSGPRSISSRWRAMTGARLEGRGQGAARRGERSCGPRRRDRRRHPRFGPDARLRQGAVVGARRQSACSLACWSTSKCRARRRSRRTSAASPARRFSSSATAWICGNRYRELPFIGESKLIPKLQTFGRYASRMT